MNVLFDNPNELNFDSAGGHRDVSESDASEIVEPDKSILLAVLGCRLHLSLRHFLSIRTKLRLHLMHGAWMRIPTHHRHQVCGSPIFAQDKILDISRYGIFHITMLAAALLRASVVVQEKPSSRFSSDGIARLHGLIESRKCYPVGWVLVAGHIQK